MALWTHKAHAHTLSYCVMSQRASLLRYRPTDMSDRFLDFPKTVVVYFSIGRSTHVTLSGRIPVSETNRVHLAKTQSHRWKCAVCT